MEYKDPNTELDSPVKINLVAKFCNVGFGDQLLAIFTQLSFAKSLCDKFPKYFTMGCINLLHDYGDLYHIPDIRNAPEQVAEMFYPWRNNKLINKPPRLYQCNVFKKLKDIRPLKTNGYPVNFNLITKNQSHIPLFTSKPGCNYIEDPYLIVKIVLQYKKTNQPVWLSLDYRVLGTFKERVSFAKTFLEEITVPLDTFTQENLEKIRKLKSEGYGVGSVHVRLTDCTLIQKNDADHTKNGRIVETCLGKQESKIKYKIKVNNWYKELCKKYNNKTLVYVFSDDIPEAKKIYGSCFNQMKNVIFVDRHPRERFTESWKDYLLMRECNEHVGSISMFGMWARSYNNYFEEIHTEDQMAFPENVVYDPK